MRGRKSVCSRANPSVSELDTDTILTQFADNDYEEDKYRVEGDVDDAGRYVERKWDDGVQDVEDAPYDAARWTGEEVQRVEDIPDRIEDRLDYDRDRIENIPDDVAGTT